MPYWMLWRTSSYLRSTYSSSPARSGSLSTPIGAWKAVRIFVGSGISGSAAGAMPQGALMAIGNIFSRAIRSSCIALASRRPRASTGIESGPPMVAIGTIGTPVEMAIRTNPLRPASTALSRSVHGRSESTSPPGHSATSRPAASAVEIESDAAGSTPILRNMSPIPGAAISASCAVPCSGRSSPNFRHHWKPTVHASHTNGAPEWMPTSSAGGGGSFSQPSISIRNHRSMSGLPTHFWCSSQAGSRSSSDHWPARSATAPSSPEA